MEVRAVCPHDCPDTCAMLVTVEDGRAIRIGGDPDHPVTQGFLCTKVAKYLERTYHEGRLLYPQIRVGAKGEGKFRRATWDEALDLIATRFRSIIDSADGPQAILPYSYAGTMGLAAGRVDGSPLLPRASARRCSSARSAPLPARRR